MSKTEFKEQALTIEQVEDLKKLGIDINGSAYWHRLLRNDLGDEPCTDWELSFNPEYPHPSTTKVQSIPTLTLADIINMLPKKLEYSGETYDIHIFRDGVRYNWVIDYFCDEYKDQLVYTPGNDLLEAAYFMLQYCAVSGYLTK